MGVLLVEEEIVIDTGEESIFTRVARVLLYIFVIFFPLWFLPITTIPVESNKLFLGVLFLGVAFVFALVGSIREGNISIVMPRIYMISGGLILFMMISAIFSESTIRSFWGLGFEAHTVLGMAITLFGLWVIPLVIRRRVQVLALLSIMTLSLSVVGILFFITSVLGAPLFNYERGFTLGGLWRITGGLFALGAVVTLPFLSKNRPWAIVMHGFFLLAAIFSNTWEAWIGLLIAALMYVIFLVSQRNIRSAPFFGALFACLIAIGSFFVHDALVQSFTFLGRPSEPVITFGTSIDVARQALFENPVFGSGPNTYALTWDQFKGSAINVSEFWRIRFSTASSSALTLMTEIGLGGVALFLLLMVQILRYGLRTLYESSMVTRSIFFGSVTLITFWFVMPVTITISVLTFLFIGLFSVSLAHDGVVPIQNIPVGFSGRVRFATLLGVFVLIIGIGGLLYGSINQYTSHIAYANGLREFLDGNAPEAQMEIRRALGHYEYDIYARTLAEISLSRIENEVGDSSRSRDERAVLFVPLFNTGVESAQSAITISPRDARNHQILARVYEEGLGTSRSFADRAYVSYQNAQVLSPYNPELLLDEARVRITVAELLLEDGEGSGTANAIDTEQREAIRLLERAIQLKPDYTEAHFALAQLYSIRGEIAEAIRRAESTATLLPNDIEVLLQLGILYYQEDSFDSAERVFENIIQLVPNHANAHYFLGSVREQRGDLDGAFEAYRIVESLNPNNAVIAEAIRRVVSGSSVDDIDIEPISE